MTIYFSKIIILILDYLQKYYRLHGKEGNFFLQLICLYTSFITYFVVKFISIVVALRYFRKKNMSTGTFLNNNMSTDNCF